MEHVNKNFEKDQLKETNNLPEFGKRLQEEEIATFHFINITINEMKSQKLYSYISIIIDRKISFKLAAL